MPEPVGLHEKLLKEIKDRLDEVTVKSNQIGFRVLLYGYYPSTSPWRGIKVDSSGRLEVVLINDYSGIKQPIKVMAWDPSASRYELIEGYEGQKTLNYDSNGNLTEIQLQVILPDGTVKTVRRTFNYDSNGNLTQVSRWEVVS